MNLKSIFLLVGAAVAPAFVACTQAHEWHRHDDPQFAHAPFVSPHATGPKAGAVKLLASAEASSGGSSAAGPASFVPPTLNAAHVFAQSFVKFNPSVRFWWNSSNFYVASDGIPTTHHQMEGIWAWQRQIPVPVYYFGTNAWALPLNPVPAAVPLPVDTNSFLQGAIALAANGIPIFNPANNRGEISALIGELDKWGGHCGRADDYHYHAAPLHLTNTLGIALPIAFAMDGYPIYSLTEPDGSAPSGLDAFRGHSTPALGYHYHASTSLPYVNGGFHGEIVVQVSTNGQGQVVSQAGWQPRVRAIRPSGTALNGAYIQTLTNIGPDQYQMFFSIPSNAPPTNYWIYTLNRAANSLSVTYSPYAVGGGVTTTNYNNWQPAPPLTSTNEPLVTTQPTNLTLAAGATATFSITAAGAGTLSYQWFQDGAELTDGSGIGGANAPTLTITNVQAGDAGAYTVVVTNTVGNTLSAAATLAVTGGANTPPTLNPIANRFLFPGQTLLITNVATDAETPGLLSFSLTSSLPGPTINPSNGLVTWATTTNNANSTNTLTVVVADNGAPNLLATQSCTVTVVGARSISQGLATTVVSNLFPAGQRVSGVGTITAFDGTVWTVPAATLFATATKLPNLWNQTAGVTPTNIAAAAPAIASLATNIIDADGEVITGYLYGDNYFELYVNGVLVGVDPVPFTPFNSCVVKFKARRPITYAVRLVDWEENLGVGTELNGGNPNHPGDGGFIASFSDGTVTGPNWKAQSFYIAPLDNPNLVVEQPDGSHDSSSASNSTTLGTNAYALHYGAPENWSAKSFNHSNWPAATTFTEAQVGVNNQWAYLNFPGQFGSSGAQFIWSKNLVLDNEVIVRFTGPASNTAPVFSALATNRYILTSGQSLLVTNTATDADLPAQMLTYSLLSPPAGATINPSSGVVTWNTTTNNAGTSNLLQVVVTDSGSPALSTTNAFTVFVRSLKPNVVVMVTDDHGWGDVSSHGGLAQTPNMDRLGSEGVRLERFYATPVCSVTRSALLTGRSPNRTSVGNTRGLDLREHIMPETFKAAGYQTFMCGKWHLGGLYNTETNTVINGVITPVIRENVEYQPQNRAWDVHYGEYTGAIGYQTHISQENGQLDWWLNGQTNLDAGWSTDLLADKAIQLLQQRDPSKPVIIYLAFNAVHGPVSAPTSYLNKYPGATGNRQRTLAALDQMDEAIGRVLNAIDAEGITTNTLVAFFGDNGGQAQSGGSNLPLRGDKGDLYDGGIHTPAAVRWPGVLPSGVTNCQQFMWVGDWFPTLCAATGVTPLNAKPFDGTNVWPLLVNATNGPFNPASYRGGPFASGSSAGSGIYDVFSDGTNLTMFKLLRDRLPGGGGGGFSNALFNIVADPYETNDLIAVPAYTNIITSLINYYGTLTAERYSPYIGVPPQSQSAPAGTNVTLYAMATVYTTPVTFQWRKDGTNIPGATASQVVDTSVYFTTLNLTNVTTADSGAYDVVVQNAAVGWPTTSNSPPATLTVTAGASNTPPVLTAISNRTIYLGATLLVTNVAADAQVPPQVLTFTLPVAPAGAGINASSGLITWTPTGGQLGTNNFTVVVSDNGAPNLSATQTFAVIVLPTAPLTISGTSRNPTTPTSAQAVNVTATVTSGTNITAVTLFHAAGGVTNSVAMLDNGLNNDGAAGDGVFAGQIPARAAGTLASYYVRAQDASGAITNDPPTAPVGVYSYTVLSSGTGWSMLKLPDTGQTGDFTTLFGEDSDYLTNAPSYTDNGNGTITDNITGLMWQKDFSPELTWENAVTYADTNTLGGHSDWRLPNTHELVSINHFGVNPPAYNTTFFTMTGTGNTNFWWTADPRANDATRIWTGSRAAVFAPRLKTDTLSAGGSNSIHARLVRGAPAPTNSPLHAFANNGDGTITDSDTGLMWQQGEIGAAVDWTNALTYAEGLVLAGYSDWRLPNAKELQSINDEKLFNPSLDTNYFPGAKIARYWTSTTRQQNPATNSWYMDFQYGNLNSASKLDLYWVRAVRRPIGGGAPANTAPQLTAQPDRTVEPGYTLLVTNVATDAQAPPQTLTFSLLAPPANASINPSTGVFTFAPVVGQLGTTNTITVVVTDNGTPALSATNSFKAIVVANTAPLLAAISDRVLNPGATLLVTNVTTDAEAPPQTFSYRLTNSPAGATINPATGLITWATSGANADTTNNFTVVVADNGLPSLSATQSFLVVVNPGSGAVTYDLMIGRPTDTSIALNLLASNIVSVYYEYGTAPGFYTAQTAASPVTNDVPSVATIGGLQPNQKYYYRMRYSTTGGAPFDNGTAGSFRTQRARGSTFSFVIEADPHNRDNVPDVWRLALTNMLQDSPDFLIDLGDTFMEEKVGITNSYYLTEPGIYDLHREVRSGFFSLIGHSVPTFLVNGNHEAELGWLLRILQVTNNPGVWGAKARQYYFPVPAPGNFYSGASAVDPFTQGPRDGYYAFEWGDALFVAIDPFWYTNPKPQQDNWAWTLGTNQYFWLKQTLENSTAKFKFVFAHHLIGGGLGNQSRGGLTYHDFFEWGGYSTNGSYDFPTKRPGWPMPIKDLLLSNNVQVFFHGHDHLYVKEEYYAPGNTSAVPTFIYQEVPQPSQNIYGTNAAPGYGYTNGPVLPGSGHLRVTVSPTNARVEYVRVFLPANEGAGRTNKMVSASYNIPAPATSNAWSMLKLPDTGQTTDFTPVPGEDADYLINPPALTNNGDGTTTDLVTGLMWQSMDGGEMAYSNAVFYAETNTLASYTDWRLPNGHELFSILNHSLNNPALNTNFFSSGGGTNAQYWWSSDPRADDTNRIWAANAGGGIGPHLKTETLSAGGPSRYHVRLVRGAAAPNRTPLHNLVDNGNGTVTDLDTGLMWQQGEAGAAGDWTNALNYAEGLALSGYTDWRLPNVKELQSINDATRINPSVDTNKFPGAKIARYWTSTSQINQPARAWFLDFQFGIASQDAKATNYWVRAVRTATNSAANTPPMLTAISNRTLGAGQWLLITNVATDAEAPPQTLTFGLLTTVSNASLNASNGIFSWRPSVTNAGTVNQFSVVVADSGAPSLSATQVFSVTVNSMGSFGVTELAMTNGNARVQLLVTGDSGLDYTVQASGDLLHWTNLFMTNYAVTPFWWLDTQSQIYTSRFYRVLLGP